MSKSKGNVICPNALAQNYTNGNPDFSNVGIFLGGFCQYFITDGVRYFLLREGTPHFDGNFSHIKLTNYLNAELANNLGNFLNRSTSRSLNADQVFLKYSNFQCQLKTFSFFFKVYHGHDQFSFDQYCTSEGRDLLAVLEGLPTNVSLHFQNFDYYLGIDLIMETLRRANTYIQNEQPWILKEKSPDHLVRLHEV